MEIIYGALLFLTLCLPTLSQLACDPDDLKCLLNHDSRDVSLVTARPAQNATLPCNVFSTGNVLKTEWWFGRRSKLIGVWMNTDKHANFDQYAIGKNSSLQIFNVDRDFVEEYECLVYYNDGQNASSFVLFRLDYSFFYKGPIFSTVFWGSCVTSLIFCVFSFILNIIWIIVRKTSMWWIHRSERLNRVRSILEAMEKYKSRQMDNLHDNYQRKVTAIRDNYHQQVDEIRSSYARQAGRFRDYKQAQVETMTQHLDNIKENYSQQMTRIRDFGTRRANRLVESYESQLNKMKTFTLQHRLKLMRQYKLKQHQINKLLENIANNENPSSNHHDQKALHDILDLHNPELVNKSDFGSHAASFYSLPDLTSTEFISNAPQLLDFKKLRHSAIENETGPSNLYNDQDIECQASSNTPLLKHHRRKSSNLRAVSSFTDCREHE